MDSPHWRESRSEGDQSQEEVVLLKGMVKTDFLKGETSLQENGLGVEVIMVQGMIGKDLHLLDSLMLLREVMKIPDRQGMVTSMAMIIMIWTQSRETLEENPHKTLHDLGRLVVDQKVSHGDRDLMTGLETREEENQNLVENMKASQEKQRKDTINKLVASGINMRKVGRREVKKTLDNLDGIRAQNLAISLGLRVECHLQKMPRK